MKMGYFSLIISSATASFDLQHRHYLFFNESNFISFLLKPAPSSRNDLKQSNLSFF
jgi:hypothetical protein